MVEIDFEEYTNVLNLMRGSLSVAITFVKGETTTFLQEHKNSLAPYHYPIIEEYNQA